MHRSKQLAAMFLLGAVLVGGVLGFSADRVLRGGAGKWGQRASRERFAEELDLTAAQRAAVDSLLDERHAKIDSLLRPIKPQLDSIIDASRAQIARLLTPEQRARFEEMQRETKREDSARNSRK